MNNTWRFDLVTYRLLAGKILRNKETVDQWAELSLSPETTDDDRMVRIMMNNDSNFASNSYICMSYMCNARPMSEEFLKDATYVNSGLALIGCWNQKVVDWVIDVYNKSIPSDATNACGNALKHVLKAYESGKFETECPEYHKYLGELLKEYYALKDKIKKFKPSAEAKNDVDKLADEYFELYQYVYRFKNFYLEVHNRLDWGVISTINLSDKMIEKLVRKGKMSGSLAEDEEFSSNTPQKSIAVKKYTGKSVRKKVWDGK